MYVYTCTFTKKVLWCRAFMGFELHILSSPVQHDTGFINWWDVGTPPGVITETGIRQGGPINPFEWKCWCWEVTLQANPNIGALSIVQDTKQNRNFSDLFGRARSFSESYQRDPRRYAIEKLAVIIYRGIFNRKS